MFLYAIYKVKDLYTGCKVKGIRLTVKKSRCPRGDLNDFI